MKIGPFGRERADKETTPWRDGAFLCTVNSTVEADILESKLRGEGIPIERRYEGAGNFLEIAMGANSICPVDVYVPASALEDAKEIIVPNPIDESFEEE